MVKDILGIAKVDPVVDANKVSRIAENASIRGDFSSVSDVRIDGSFDGVLYTAGRAVVGESAKMKGAMLCSNADVWGRMDGDIYVKDTLTLKSSAVVNGNIRVRRLQVEMGAAINGSCAMINDGDFSKFVSEKVEYAPSASGDEVSCVDSSDPDDVQSSQQG